MTRVRILRTAAVLFLFAGFSIVPSRLIWPCCQEVEAYHKISGKAIFSEAKYLSSRTFLGRETFTSELDRAGRYIAKKFDKYGLKPINPEHGFFQVREVDYSVVGRSNHFRVGGIAFREGIDYRVGAVGAGTVESQAVFLGYGITTTTYDSYAGVDVRGKIVLVMEGKPNIKGPEFGVAPLHDVLAFNAINHGAAAMLFVEGTSPKNRKLPIPARYAMESMTPVLESARALGLIRVDEEAKQAWHKFPLIYVTQKVADCLLTEAGWTSAGLKQKIDETGRPLSFSLSHRISVRSDVSHGPRKIMNIIGLVEGRDPVLKEETVIIGAHYDHVGHLNVQGAKQIAFGADDNASGTAALLEIGRIMAKYPVKPKRSVLLIAFTGEEKGGLGSQFYSGHPLRSLADTKAMLNMDMIGRNDSKKIGVYSSRADLTELSRDLGRRVGIIPEPLEEGHAASSDHVFFLAKNVPVIFYYDGGGDFAHTALDIWNRLSPEKMESVARLCFLTAWRLANQE